MLKESVRPAVDYCRILRSKSIKLQSLQSRGEDGGTYCHMLNCLRGVLEAMSDIREVSRRVAGYR